MGLPKGKCQLLFAFPFPLSSHRGKIQFSLADGYSEPHYYRLTKMMAGQKPQFCTHLWI